MIFVVCKVQHLRCIERSSYKWLLYLVFVVLFSTFEVPIKFRVASPIGVHKSMKTYVQNMC